MAVGSALKKFGAQYCIEFQELLKHLVKNSPAERDKLLHFEGLSSFLCRVNIDGIPVALSGSKLSEIGTGCYIELNSFLTLMFELKFDCELVIKGMIYQLRESGLCTVECATQTEDQLELQTIENPAASLIPCKLHTSLDCATQTENSAGLEMAMELLGVTEKINIKTESHFDEDLENLHPGSVEADNEAENVMDSKHDSGDGAVRTRLKKRNVKRDKRKPKPKTNDMSRKKGIF